MLNIIRTLQFIITLNYILKIKKLHFINKSIVTDMLNIICQVNINFQKIINN